MGASKVLLVDSYDSFTHNLAALIVEAIPSSEVYIIHNDQLSSSEVIESLQYFSAVVVGPGPGSPEISSDVGIVKDLWHLPQSSLLPIFGVCLGLQSLAVENGANLKRLEVVKHGQLSRIQHDGDGLFEGIVDAEVVRYHSLHVQAAGSAPKLQELAWADDGAENGGRVVMALKHRFRPFWAVQYHPESVRTDGSGLQILQNFWSLARRWSSDHARVEVDWSEGATALVGQPWPHHSPCRTQASQQRSVVTTTTIHAPHLTAPQICEISGVHNSPTDFVLLESRAQPGRYSIIACLQPTSLKVSHHVGDDFVLLRRSKHSAFERLGSDIWTWLAAFSRAKYAVGGLPNIPFWGGFIGYFSYEIGVHSLGCKIRHQGGHKHPDASLVFVERSIVVDTMTGDVHIQSIIPNDAGWVAATALTLRTAANIADAEVSTAKCDRVHASSFMLPDKAAYINKVNLAKEHLYAGESYELCVTARTRVAVPKSYPGSSCASSWDLYSTVRSVNPAPYGAYVRIHPTTLVSSSPERFLSCSRPPYQKFQLRPIKGTVRKGCDMTRERAENILNSPKEIAENLMIVDLIRHDLYGVLGKDVKVTKFCGIEEYQTVWQLVSVIEGSPHFAQGDQTCDNQLGWEVLKRSLPPGIMTGAPKKRSVEILQNLEDDARNLYSGVVGYHCVSGAADWSVVIRSCFKYDPHPDDPDGYDKDEWVLGAGGAITALSDAEAEWDEMEVKLQSVLRAFKLESLA
ncbi:para-aminobenzoate synthase [Rickenella mellea]|uniref:aminodeoxychorismate synthase n=1 Tax=Rickenella mellea TaxID=50990 RepID=A0A4Y7QK86_9AGAM|nr:para-aminobenzoate synthase [Rickenella mellea]